MRAAALLQPAEGSIVELGPGEWIGRAWTASWRLDDPQVSEAHALVSLRGDQLWLLALRGRFLVGREPSVGIALAPGQVIALSPESSFTVLRIDLPAELLALEAPGVARQVPGGPTSVFGGPTPRLEPGVQPGAPAVIWPDGRGWRLRLAGQQATELEFGDTFLVQGVCFRAAAVALADGLATPTRHGLDAPLELVARYDTVHLRRANLPPLVLVGQMARVLSEVATAGAPLSWESLAALLWGDGERDAQRRRWDVLLTRLRQRLREGGVRPDLLQATGHGLLELVLRPGDRVVDET